MTRLIVAMVLLLFPVTASAQAATVGPNCTATWSAPATNTDGSAVTVNEITAYRVYVDKATITPGVTVPTLSVGGSTVSAKICAGLVAGNHTVAVSAVAGPNEGPATAPFAFALVTVTPASPSNLQVSP